MNQNGKSRLSNRIADALERLAPPVPADLDLGTRRRVCLASRRNALLPLASVAALPLDLLEGHQPLARYAAGKHRALCQWTVAANNALLWGARGQGKSSLVKAVHAHINEGRQSAESG
jgi:predicted AAA+ superfamily ATPase